MDLGQERLGVLAPTLGRARAAALLLARVRGGAIFPFSFAAYLASPEAPNRIVLCPEGDSVETEVDFLREALDRLLWRAPDRVLSAAIEGLLGSLPLAPDRSRIRAGRPAAGGLKTALLLEGTVTPARARALAEQDCRLWIVENARRVRVGRRQMAALRRAGVRWSALEPISLAGLLASARLARARSLWRSLLPPGTPVWVAPASVSAKIRRVRC